MPIDIINNEKFQEKVEEHYEEERGNGNEGYERFKVKCVETADKMTKKNRGWGSVSNDKVSNYLRPKKRRFEIQLQMKFKKMMHL